MPKETTVQHRVEGYEICLWHCKADVCAADARQHWAAEIRWIQGLRISAKTVSAGLWMELNVIDSWVVENSHRLIIIN